MVDINSAALKGFISTFDLPAVFRESKAVQALCESNAVTEETFVHKNHEVITLEMSHFSFNKLDGLQYFSALKELCVVTHEIPVLEGLSQCPLLEALWVADCKVDKIQGLEKNLRLKRLYLYSNKISKIENIAHLTKLEVLWLGDNNITVLEGLETLVNLRSLWIQGNHIQTIGQALDKNIALREVNLSRNQISSFRELTNLARLPNLENLWLADVTFGDNPVCQLCNYQTHVLYHLKYLLKLDSGSVTEESRRTAESTYAKKKMYYNMKFKTLKRLVNGQMKNAAQVREEHETQIYAHLEPLYREICELNRVKEENSNNVSPVISMSASGSEPPRPSVDDCDKKLVGLRKFEAEQLAIVSNIESKNTELESILRNYQEEEITRVQLELETGGNIRLEQGNINDAWYSSCSDLISSRFFNADFDGFGISGIKIHRVYRVHNRFLRSQFEKAMQTPHEGDDKSKPQVEYLFYTEPPNTRGSHLTIDHIVEFGFPSADEFEKHTREASVPLTNSVGMCEAPKVSEFLKNTSGSNSALSASTAVPPVRLLIVKSLLGKFTQGNDNTPSDHTHYQNCQSVFKPKPGDPKQKSWFVFDNTLLLPEYVVEFDYVMHSSKASALSLLTAQSGEEVEDGDEATKIVSRFTRVCSALTGLVKQNSVAGVVDSPPRVPRQPPVFVVTDDVLRTYTKGHSFSSITYLNLSCTGLTRLDGLSLLVNLKTLIAAHNTIRRIEALSDLRCLERLDFSYNQIRRIEGIKGLPLKVLVVRNNLISRIDDIIVLKKYATGLHELDLRNNQICRARGYKVLVLRRLPNLTSLDGVLLSETEKTTAREGSPSLSPQLIRANSYTRRHDALPVAPSDGDEWWTRVVVLVLRHCGIRRLSHLDKLVNIRRADFADNLIARLDGLETLRTLEELSLEDNCIVKIDQLAKLSALRKLDLGRNQIGSVEGLEGLVHLTQLSLEDNVVTSLSGFQHFTGLMELYLGNNKITDRREIHHLVPLDRLVILDLSGNDVELIESYRLFVVHRLRRLKVLDGRVIEVHEQNGAKERFAGRLTLDVLEDKVGHTLFQALRSIDLGNMKLKDIEQLNAEDFVQLREVTLDHNALVTAKGLSKLVSIEVLRLNHNKINDLGLSLNGVSELSRLEVLELANNSVSSITSLQLQGFPNLKVLILASNNVTKIDGLEGLTQLRRLVLDKNKIKSVEDGALAQLGELQILQLDENLMKSLVGLLPLTKLQVLTLGQNRITDLSDIDKLHLPNLEEVTFAGNAVARKLHYRAHAIMCGNALKVVDGKMVGDEERAKAEFLLAKDGNSSGNLSSMTPPPSMMHDDVSSPQTNKKVALKVNMMDFSSMLGTLPSTSDPHLSSPTNSRSLGGSGVRRKPAAAPSPTWTSKLTKPSSPMWK